MDNQPNEERKEIGNVGILDLRRATEASVRRVSRIGNIGLVAITPETAGLITRISVGNVGATVEIPAESKLQVVDGQAQMHHSTVEDLGEPMCMVVNGQLIIHPDVTADDIRKAFAQLAVNGRIVAPEHLAGAVESRLVYRAGEIATYASAPALQLVQGPFALDENKLRGLADGSQLVVIGKMNLRDVLPDDLIVTKIAGLQVIGRLTCHEENVTALTTRLVSKSTKMTVIPTGYSVIDRDVRLGAADVTSLPARRLYCTGRVVIGADVDPAELDQSLEALVVEDLLICPIALRTVIAKKCNLLNTRSIFYEGDLWLVDGEATLAPARFEFLDGKATVVVFGELSIDSELEGRQLAARLAQVHNLGEIRGTASQIAAIESRLGLNQGALEDVSRASSGEGGGIGNLGLLVL